MSAYDPQSTYIVTDPRQLKAFTDPLRSRILSVLVKDSFTVQQLTNMLNEPQAKVFYHVKYLLNAELIRLIDTQVKNGYIEKYYRALARTYVLQPSMDARPSIIDAEFEAIRQEVSNSSAKWQHNPPRLTLRGAQMSPEKAAEFYELLLDFIAKFWINADEQHDSIENNISQRNESDSVFNLAIVLYRDSIESEKP